MIQFFFVLLDILYFHLAQNAVYYGVEDRYLLFYRNGLALALLQYFHDTFTLCKSLLGILIQIGSELGEGLQLSKLRVNELQGTGNLLHGLNLCISAYTGYGDTGVNRRHDSAMEKLGLEENLSVCNGDDIGRNIGRYISCLCLNNRKRRKGSSSKLFGKLSRSL